MQRSHRSILVAVIGLSLAASSAIACSLRESVPRVVAIAATCCGWVIERLVHVADRVAHRQALPTLAQLLRLPGAKAIANRLVRCTMPVVSSPWRMCPSV